MTWTRDELRRIFLNAQQRSLDQLADLRDLEAEYRQLVTNESASERESWSSGGARAAHAVAEAVGHAPAA